MADCTCNNFPASLGNVTFGANVGIGTDSPTVANTGLHVYGAYPEIRIEGIGASGAARIRAINAAGGGGAWLFGAGAWTGASSFQIAHGALLFTIETNGNVGIGTTTPGEKLEVNGDIKVNGHIKMEAGKWLMLDGGAPSDKGIQYDPAPKTLNVRNNEDGGDMYLTVKNGRIYFNQYGGANVGHVEVPSGNMMLNGSLSLGGPINKIQGQANVGIAANAFDDLIFNYNGAVYWFKGTQGGGDQGGSPQNQKMKLDTDGSLWFGPAASARKAIDSQGRCLYG